MKTTFISAMAVALALSAPTLAFAASQDKTQSPASAASEQNAQTTQGTQNQNQHHQSNVLTINKLKSDLEKAGFSDVKILQDSFVVQAKDKEGNPTIMSLSPSGVVAISALSEQKQAKASNTSPNSSGSQTH
jgi:glucose/arabinose dehydrogenase